MCDFLLFRVFGALDQIPHVDGTTGADLGGGKEESSADSVWSVCGQCVCVCVCVCACACTYVCVYVCV